VNFFRFFRGLLPLVVGCSISVGGFAADEALLVAAGAGYKRPVTELCAAFEKQSGIKVEQFFGNMAQVLSQTKETGKVGMVMGDKLFLENNQHVKFSRFAPLGEGRLVLAYAKGQSLQSADELLDGRFVRIAMPDPKNAIYGKAASEFMAATGLADKLQSRLMVVATVPQVSAYLVSGDVEAGFLNLTDVLGIKDKIGGYLEVDRAHYQPILIAGGVVQGFEDTAAVKSLEVFMASPEARAIMARHGL